MRDVDYVSRCGRWGRINLVFVVLFLVGSHYKMKIRWWKMFLQSPQLTLLELSGELPYSYFLAIYNSPFQYFSK